MTSRSLLTPRNETARSRVTDQRTVPGPATCGSSLTTTRRAVKGLSVRVAKRLNRLMGRTGRVIGDRYHAHALRTPTEVANALAYVLGNFVRHAARRGEMISASWIDPYSSAAVSVELTGPPLIVAPQTWLLRGGWRRARLGATVSA